MIGIYDYTVILTYLSLLSAGTGIAVSLSGGGHPYIGMLFFLICGVCDLFDGKVARTKKGRTDIEKRFGIQIDSLSDLVAFGILPSCIGIALIRRSSFLNNTVHITDGSWPHRILYAALIGVMLLYALAALIRLAWYNVTEEERQKTEDGNRKYFVGIPVTMSTFFFSLVMMVQYIIPVDVTILFFVVALFLTFGFVSKLKIPKPGFREIAAMIIFAGVFFGALLVIRYFFF